MKVILAQPRGFCTGMVRAVDIVEAAPDKHLLPVSARHEIGHKGHAVERLKAKGAQFVESLIRSRLARDVAMSPGVEEDIEFRLPFELLNA
jgi:4-hydroxy-3-methylbut-2-enyl diphosphate reductase IspH